MTPFNRRILGINFVATLAVMAAQGTFTRLLPPAALFEMFLISAVFCNTIGGLIAVVLPKVQPRVAHLRPARRWAALIAVLLAVNAVGCALSLLVFTAVGLVWWRDMYGQWLLSMRFGVLFTLFFGIVGSLTEGLRSDLERTALALRTKERDEAEARRLATEARLASLESRVQPHFLFNTLNSIASLVHSNPTGAERMTTQLSALLRSSLDTASLPSVPLEQELQVVRDYLAIEQVRLGDRLRFTIDAPASEGSTLVPRMALQTLVENSVKFAVAPRREGGSIAVRAERSGQTLRLSVEDDGPGFLYESVPAGHGLHLLGERLGMAYGERARMTVDSRPGRTIVAIALDTPV